MRRWTRRLLFAIQFLTRYPIRANLPLQEDDYARSSVFFPLVGALVGLFCLFFAWLGSQASSMLVAAAFAALGSCWITGAFHMDGLADSYDATKHRSRRGRLRAMKDSRIGMRGTIAIAIDLFLRVAAIYALTYGAETLDWKDRFYVCRCALVAPVCGRIAIVAGGAVSRSAKPEGLGALFIDRMGALDLLRASLCFVPIVYVCYGPLDTALLYFVSVATGMIVAGVLSVRIHGITGDSFGCINEYGEIVALLLLVALKYLREFSLLPF